KPRSCSVKCHNILQTSTVPKTTKYTYCRLDELKPQAVVNVYGVVLFFKQPYKTLGSDYCTFLKITDQSNSTISCNIFLPKLEDHPKIFKAGDIIRMHRVKVTPFNDSFNLVKSHGFSAVTFDGTEGEPVEPRTSNQNYHFEADDQRVVEELRAWSAQRVQLPAPASMTLSTVQPRAYFDLTCQLLAKAPVDSTCTMLRVWDGTRCPHTLLKVLVEPEATVGPTSFSPERERIIANVLIYDNHVEAAGQLQPGDFLRIYNLRAIQGSSRVPGPTGSQPAELDHLAFHLHGGTAYGRGIRVLPENSADVQELKRAIAAFMQEEEDAAMLDVWGTPPESMGEPITERTCRHDTNPVTLSEVQGSDHGQIHHVRVRVKSYQPQRLHQSLKLFCDKCSTMQDVPDEDQVSAVFAEACQDSEPCPAPVWALYGAVPLPSESEFPFLTYSFTSVMMSFLGAGLEQVTKLSSSYLNIVPVRSSGGQLAPLDLSAPVLFRGRRRFYGCKKCSNPAVREPNVEGVEVVSEKLVAEALGVELLRYGLLLRLELQDSSGSLDVLLWRDSELFFNVCAADAATNQESQNHIHHTMESLCPPEGSTARRPWLDVCLVSYEWHGLYTSW
uniref:Protection of telomeres protein 1 n=1 Tax=Neogobius melanostomus TaxID=47308 RepID=A0A8C6SUC9_9GOBI